MFITGIVTIFTMLLISGGPNAAAARYPILRPATATDRLLIVAPHIDDEVIAAGGYAADAIRNGSEVYVVFLTAGDCSRFSARILSKTLDPTAKNYLNVGRTRIAEARKVMARLGIAEDHFFILGYPDRGLRRILQKPDDVIRSQSTRELSVPYSDAMSPGNPYSYANLSNDLHRVVEIADPTIVIAPVSFDVHPDHSAAADLTDGVLANMNVHPERLGYLVHTSRLPRSLVWLPDRSVLPPVRYQDQTWTIYPLTKAGQHEKDGVLLTYKSQRPYVFMLRNAFVRKNELFLVYASGSKQLSGPATVAR